jgi:hypothetical protein
LIEASYNEFAAMIRFECRCQHVFEVPPEMAGDAIQCPQCGLLNDVPVLSQLADLDEHGMYKVGEDTTLKEPDRLEQLNRSFAPTRVDEYGNDIDLRTTMEEFRKLGADDDILDLAADARPAAPRYDPVTGELIREIELGEDHHPVQPPIPMASPALDYARAHRGSTSGVTPARALALLFGPENFIVIVFVFLIAVFVNLLFAGPIALLAHFANVIDETGPEDRDEMPRPFRHLSWTDDLWGPFVHFMFALMYAYSPLVVIGFLQLPRWPGELIIGIAAVLCSIIFPGVLLTTATSGTTLNLRPDIVLRTIGRSGGTYVWAVLVWFAASVMYFDGVVACFGRSAMLLVQGHFGSPMLWLQSYTELFGGVILMHYFCWLLGLIYREHQPDFPWVLQRHIRVNGQEAGAVIDASLRVKQQDRAEREALRSMRGRV